MESYSQITVKFILMQQKFFVVINIYKFKILIYKWKAKSNCREVAYLKIMKRKSQFMTL